MADDVKAMMTELAAKLTSSEEVSGFLTKTLYVLDGSAIPCSSWSAMNRFFISLTGTLDARGYRQWQEVGRNVKKGAKAVYILVPCFGKKEVEGGDEVEVLKFFKRVPVFRYEDTEGEPLEYQERMEALNAGIKALPLYNVAESIGIPVAYAYSAGGKYYGCYKYGTEKAIELCTDSEQTFFHELAHAIDHELGFWSDSDAEMNEIVAEFTACFLASQYGKHANLLYTRNYIARQGKLSDVFKALDRAAEIVRFIRNVEAEKSVAV